MSIDNEQRQFIDKNGLEQFWADVQKYLTRNYKSLPAGMQFSQIFQHNGQLHVLVEPFGGQGDDRKEASRTSLDVYSKEEVDEAIETAVVDNGRYLGQMSLTEINHLPVEPHNGDMVNIKFDELTDSEYINPSTHLGKVYNNWDGVQGHSYVEVADGDNVIYDLHAITHVWDRQAGNYKVKQDATSVDFDEYKVILNISQNENGEISVTQQTIPTATVEKLGLTTLAEVVTDGDTVNDKAATPKAVAEAIAAAIGGLDVANITGFGQDKTLASLTETDGKIAATFQDILVDTDNIQDNAVTTAKIDDDAVTSAKIGDGEVKTANIENSAVTEDKINDGAVTTTKIGDGAVTSAKIADGTIQTEDIADSQITTEKIADSAVTTGKIAHDAITEDKIADGAVQNEHIAADAVHEEQIQDGSVTRSKIANDGIDGTKIADDAIGNEHIAADAVQEEQIQDNAVTTDKIVNDAVNGDKIADDSVGNEHIAADAVHEEQILDGSVTNSKIDDGAVTYEKVTNDAEHPFPIDISGNAATATTVQEGGELDQRIDAIETGKADKVTGATAGNFASLDAEGNLVDSGHKHSDYKTVQAAVPSPEVPQSGTTTSLSFIDTVSQNANGEISATKKSVPKSDAIDLNSSDTLATSAAVKAAVDASHSEVSGLNCADQLSLNGHFNKKYITRLSQLNGQMSYDSDSMAEGPVENSAAPVTGHALYTEHLQRSQFDEWVHSLIPDVAEPSNQLADKAYVDAIGERLEARYLSAYDAEHDQYIPFPTYAAFKAAADRLIPDQFYYNGTAVSEIGDRKLDNNDVIVITADETHLNEIQGPSTTRYRYQCDVATGDNGHWYFEYVINNTALNAAQLLAINSGITAEYKASYDNHLASQGQDPNHTNPHHVTFDQLLGRNGVDSTELGVLDGVDTDHIGAAQINTLRDIGEEDPAQGTIQYQLNDKMERIDPASSEPGYTVSNKIAVVNDHDLVNGRFGVKDSGAEITSYYHPDDDINPVTGSSVKKAIDELDNVATSSHQDEKVIVTVTEENGIVTEVAVDDSNAASAAQGAKADTAIQTVSVLDNGGQSAHVLPKDNNNAVTVDLSDYKRRQTAVSDPAAQGTALSFISGISQDTEGVITPYKKSVPVDQDYVSDGTNPASGTAITRALGTLDNTVTATGGTNIGLQLVEENGIVTGVTLTDSTINSTDLANAIDSLDATVDSEHGTNVSVQVIEEDGVITGVNVSDNTVNPTDLVNAIDALNATVDSTGGVNVDVQVVEENGVITGVTVDDRSINSDDLATAISVKADKVTNATAGNLATLDSTGNLEDSGVHVTSTYRDTTQTDEHQKDEYRNNPVTGTAVDAAIAESASGDRQYVDDKIDALDAEITSVDGTNVQVKVTEVDGKITDVNIAKDDSINAADLGHAIADLDAEETSADGKNVQVKVTEVDGKITGVNITKDDSINAADLGHAIADLDAEETSVDGTNVQFKVTEVDGKITAVNVATDNTVNAADVANKVETEINKLDSTKTGSGPNVSVTVAEVDGKIDSVSVTDNSINSTDLATAIQGLDAEKESSDGTNVQFKVTEVDGKIAGVSVTTDNTVNATDVANKVETEINKLDSSATSTDGTNVQVKVTEVDGKISAVNITSDNTVNSTDVSSAITTAVNALDVQAITGSTSKTITSISETDGLIDATYEDILVGTSNIDTGAVTTEKIAAKAVTTDKLDDGAVTTVKIDNGAVTTDKINDKAVTTGKIADTAVTTGKIADEAVTTAKIDNEAVTTGKIADEAVTTAKIDDGAVTYEKVTNDEDHPFPIDISGNAANATHADDASHADVADDVSEGSALDQRLDAIEEDISDLDDAKADKVTGATDGNFAGLDSNGNLTDSGHRHSDYKTKQDAITKTGHVLKTVASLTQNANGEIDATFSDIQSATTGQKGVVQLAGSIGATVASENNKAASEKAVRDAIDNAIGGTIDSLDVEEVGGAGMYISAISETDGKISATATTMDTTPTSDSANAVTSGGVYTAINSAVNALDATVSGSSTNISVSVTETDGKLTSITVTDTAATSDHVHGNISNDGKVGTAANKVLVTTTDGEVVAGDIDGTYNASTNKIATQSTVTSAINALDVSGISGFGADKTLATLTETDGKIAASFQSIQIAESQVTGLETDLDGIDDALDTKEDKANKVTSWSATTTDTSYPSEKLVKDSLDTKVDKTTKVNGHALSGDVTVTKGDVGLGSVVNTGDSDTPVSGGTTKFTTGGAYTELNKKADKTATVSNVAYDGTSKKITKTINGTTSDVVTAATLKADMALDNVANTNITVSATDGVTDNTNNVTYKYEHPTTTNTAAAAVKVGKDGLGHVVLGAALQKGDVGLGNVENTSITVSATDGVKDNTNNVTYKYVHPAFTAKAASAKKVGLDAEGHVVLGDALTKTDVGLDLVKNQAITVTGTSVSDGTNTFNKYTHPTTTAHAAAAVKVGNDGTGHVVLGDALVKGDVGLGNVDNTSDADKPVSTAQQTALDAKVDKTAGVTAVTWDSTNKKITKTINGTTSDVVTAATLKTAMALNNVTNDAQVKRSEMGVANGVATLGADGKVPSSQLPSYIDDVLEGYYYNGEFYRDAAHTDMYTHESGKVYVDLDTNLTYRWGGNEAGYVKIASDLALGTTHSTAYYGDQGEAAYQHSLVVSGNPHHVTKAEVGLGRVSNTTITVSATDGVTSNDGTTSVTYKYTHPTTTAVAASAKKVGYDSQGHVVLGDALVKGDVGLGNVANTNITVSATDGVKDNTNNVTYKYSHPTKTAVEASAKKVGYDNQGHVVLGDALAKGDVGLGNVDNTSDATKKTNFTGSIASGNTGFVTGGDAYTELNKKADKTATVSTVTYDTTGKKITKTINGTTTDVVTAAKLKEDMALDLVKNQAITVTSTSVSDGTNTFTKYTHPTYTAATAAAVKVGRDSTGHVTIGDALVKGDVGLGNVDNTSDATKKTNFTGAVASGNTGFPTGGDVYTAIADNGKGVEIVEPYVTTFEEMSAIVDAGKIPLLYVDSQQLYYPLYSITGTGNNRVYYFANTHVGSINNPMSDILYDKYSCAKGTSGTSWAWLPTHTIENVTHKVSSWSSTTTDVHYPTEKLVKDSLDGKASSTHTHGNITNAGAIGTASGQAVYTTTNGVLTAGSLATSDPSASGNALSFIATVSQDAKGQITATKKTVSTMGAASSSAAGTTGLVPAPGSGKQDAFLRGDGTWQTPVDSKVTQNLLAATTDAEYPVILKNSTTATDSPTSTENYAAGITVNPKNKSVTATKFVGSLEGTANTAKAYDTSFTGTNSIKSALDGKASSTHTHGNITNAGALQTTDVDIASGDKLVITDSSNSNKVARTSTSFDGNTVTKALTPKGTFEDFAKQADIDTAIEEIPSLSLVGDNHITVTTDDDTGTVTIATDLASQTAYTAKGSATKVPQITTNALGQVTGITEVTISGVAPAAHAHGNISNSGAIGTTSGQAVYTTTDGVLTAGSLATSDPTASGNALSFIATVSQDAKGKITATKKSVTVDSTYSSTGTNPVNGTAIAAAIGTLDVTAITGGTGKTITSISETDGKISATYSNISITKSQVSDFSHAHGNITNAGGITTDAVTVASGDSIVVVDSSDTSKKVVKSSISFDGSTTTQALTKAGTWATFNNYSHPAGSAPSVTGFPTAGGTLSFGGTFDVNQVSTDSTSHVSSITKRTFTLPSLGTTSTTAAAGDHTHATSIASSTGTNQLSLAANTKYAITAGGTAFVFTTPKDTTYTSKAAASGGTDVSLVTTGEKYTWNNKQDALTEMTTQEVSDLVAAFAS